MMIDDPVQTVLLIADLNAELPFRATLSKQLIRLFKQEKVPLPRSTHIEVVKITYLGDGGGIMCKVSDGTQTEHPHFVSLTHLILPRKLDCYSDAVRYQKRRVKKLRRENQYGPTLANNPGSE